MGFFGALDTARKLAGALSTVTAEASASAKGTRDALPFLRSKGVTFIDDMTAFHAGAPGRELPGFIDFPGFTVGDRFRIGADSRVFGIGGITGKARIDELSATGMQVSVEAGVGPLRQSLQIHAHQLTPKLAEFEVAGVGASSPYLAQITEAGKGVAQLKAIGASGPVRITAQGADQITLQFQIGGQPSKIVLELI